MTRSSRRTFLQRSGLGVAGATLLGTTPVIRAARRPGGKYRVAVIGRTGRGDYGHGLDTVWKSIDNATVVAVADEDPKGRAEAVKRLDAPEAYADYHEMLDKQKPDIVSVGPRWIDCHREMVIACAQRGCHMFLEKPMCRTLDEADEMVTACERAKVKVAIAHQTRYSPRLERVREMIADGKLGDLLELRGRGKEDRRGGGEDLMVLGTHVMDLMRLLAGDPRWCFARVLERGRPVTKADVRSGGDAISRMAGDEIHAMYGFASPTMGYFSTYRTQDGASSRFGLYVHGSKGLLTIRTGSLPEVWFVADPSWAPGESKAKWQPVTSAGLDKPEPLEAGPSAQHLGNVLIVKDLIRAIETDTQPKGSIYDGRAALEMILAVYESHRLQAAAELPLANRRHPLDLLE